MTKAHETPVSDAQMWGSPCHVSHVSLIVSLAVGLVFVLERHIVPLGKVRIIPWPRLDVRGLGLWCDSQAV